MADFDDNLSMQEIMDKLDDIVFALNDIADYAASNNSGSSSSTGGRKTDLSKSKDFNKFKRSLGDVSKQFSGGSLSIGKVISSVGKMNAVLGIAATAVVKVTQATIKYNSALNESLSRLNGASTSTSKLSSGVRNMSSAFSEFMQTLGNTWIGKLVGSFTNMMGEGLRGLSSFIATGNPANDTRKGASATENYIRVLAGKSGRGVTDLASGYDALYYAIAGGGMGSARSEEGARALFERTLQYGADRGLDDSAVAKLMAEYASMISSGGGTSSISGASLDKNIMSYLAYSKYGVSTDMLGEEASTELAVSSLLEQTNTALSKGNDYLVTAQRNWRKYGEAIQDAKQSLFSFDEVITVDAKIRDANGDSWAGGFNAGGSDESAGIPIVPVPGGNGGDGGTGAAPNLENVLENVWEAVKEKVVETVMGTSLETQPGLSAIWDTLVTFLIAAVLGVAFVPVAGVKAIWKAIKGVITAAIEGVVLPVVSGVKAIWKAIKTVILAAIGLAVVPVASGVKAIWKAIKTVIQTAIEAVPVSVKSGVKAVWNAIKAVIVAAIGLIALPVLSGVKAVWEAIKTVITGAVGEVALDLASGVKSVWEKVLGVILSAIGAAALSIGTGLTSIWELILRKIRRGIEDTPDFTSPAPEPVTNNEPVNIPSGEIGYAPEPVTPGVAGGGAISFNDNSADDIVDSNGNTWGLGTMPQELADFLIANGADAEAVNSLMGLGYTLKSGKMYDAYKTWSKNQGYARAADKIGKFNDVAQWFAVGLLAIPTLAALGVEGLAALGASGGAAWVGAQASGGVMTGPSFGLMGEAGKEAVVPLESEAGINYLASAMREAGGAGQTTVNVNLNGQILEMSDYNVRRLGEKLGAVIDNERNRRGGLNYDSFGQQ